MVPVFPIRMLRGFTSPALVRVGYRYTVSPFCCKLSLVIDVSIRTCLGPGWEMHLCLITYESIWLCSGGKIHAHNITYLKLIY